MVIIPQCMACRHVDQDGKIRPAGEKYLACKAFPAGIPDEILWNRVFHDTPYEGDHGIQFEPVEQNKLATRH